jgi:hypothetical protein
MKKHIYRNVVLALLLLLAFQLQVAGQGYTQKVIVKLYDPFHGVPIGNASVDIDLRIVEALPDGSTYMHTIDELKELNINGVTNASGVFEAFVPVRGANNYVTVRALKKGYATMVNMATKIEKRSPSAITIEMLPDEDDQGVSTLRAGARGETLDEFVWKRKLLLEQEKIDKGYFIGVDKDTPAEDGNLQNRSAEAVAAACVTFTVPTTVRVTGLVDGYSGQCGSSGYTGNINFDDYIAGVISKEMGSGFPLEALKAQSVAARTFSLNNIENGRGANCGHAYTSTIPQKCIDATRATSGIVAIYSNNAISAYYSARCHGDYTRSASIASCALGTPSGAAAYCKSVACSGHANCVNVEGGSLCCTKWNSERSRNETVFGHGVGLCQRGTQGFANSGWGWEQIIRRFYSNISLSCGTNSNCPSTLTFASAIASGTYEASGTITASAALSANAAVTFDAGTSITLGIGFSATYDNGNTFTAQLGGCGSTLAARNMPLAENSLSMPASDEEEIKIYPNPSSTGTVTIEFTEAHEGPVSIVIADMMGNEVKSLTANGEQQLQEQRSFEVNTSGFRPGMYFVVVRTSTGRKSLPLVIK